MTATWRARRFDSWDISRLANRRPAATPNDEAAQDMWGRTASRLMALELEFF